LRNTYNDGAKERKSERTFPENAWHMPNPFVSCLIVTNSRQ